MMDRGSDTSLRQLFFFSLMGETDQILFIYPEHVLDDLC